ncbi:MAG: ABC transporter permease [Gemmatimonadetes bacterium]|nr:ABC transporter permease [Gemmatimonadota bacterium]
MGGGDRVPQGGGPGGGPGRPGGLRGAIPFRRDQLRALGLVAPLLIFVGVTFIAPLATMLTRSVHDPVVADALPETLALLRDWDGDGLPAEAVYETAARELERLGEERTIGQVAGRVNRVQGGLRSVFTRTVRELADAAPDPAVAAETPWRDALAGIDPAWADPMTWHAVRTTGERFTSRHYLNAVDRERLPDGTIARQPEERRIYLRLFWRTLLVSGTITVLCLLLGYPIAHLIARAPPRRAALLLVLVLVPFWTSLLVRTTSWIVLLQTQGVINDLLVAIGLVSDDGRLAMVYNMTGTIIAMTHVLLPFMVLPLYSVMRGIPPQYMSAAASLGATPVQAFLRVYWPQSLPGVGAGALLVFILSIGFYITPALVGGSDGQLISNMIAYHMQTSLNWGLAGALGGILLVGVLALYLVYDRLVGVERMGLS